MKDRLLSTVDLTLAQQEHVRNALHLLHKKTRTWDHLAAILKFEPTTLVHVAHARRSVSVLLAFRIARLVGICVEALLAGHYPGPGFCPRCGYGFKRGQRERA